ncbi:MAG: PIG-L family deacetylase [Chitinophagales bacterium]
MKKIISFLLPLFFSFDLLAQTPTTWTSVDMYQAIRKLNVLGTVLYLAAHPDDDNSRLIAYLSKEKLYRTGYLSMTRGDGGQNLIGDEQGFELGLIRTQELLASRKVDGGEQFFSRAYDFGYSKSPEETFSIWDKEKMLSDVVWVIRKFQPDIVITRFPTTGEGGHGHHTASAILANEAYSAAADPNRFPEQLKYVKTWQVKRVLWNTFNFGGANTTNSDQFHFDDGIYNPLLGKSYGEIGAASRSQNRTQGTGSTSVIGETIEYFRATKGDQPINDLMDGVDVSWKRIKGGEEIEKTVNELIASFDFLHPVNSIKGLVKLYQALLQLPDGYWKTQKLKETNELIEQCSGIFIDVTSAQQYAVQTDSVRINFFFNNRLGVNAALKQIKIDAFDSSLNQTLNKNVNLFFRKTFFVPDSKPITQPYWLANKMEEGYFNVNDQQKIGQADVDPAFIANVTVMIEGQEINFEKPVKYKFTDPVRGELYEPLVVIPPFDVSIPNELVVYKIGSKDNPTQPSIIKANKDVADVKIFAGDRSIPASEKLDLVKGQLKEVETLKPFNTTDTVSKLTETEFRYKKDGDIAKSIRNIKYDHIPYIVYFKNAEGRQLALKIETYGKKIGYIPGAGDKIPAALEQMGYDVNTLSPKELTKNDLGKFDAIIVGVRAYNTNELMNNYYDKLMKYIYDGGNLIVQYNRNNQALAKMSPYPFVISGARITDENAEVKFLQPDHPVMNFPNKITQDDFKGWIQERSIYHASNFDRTKFETIFSMHDPGESDNDGSLIIAKYGSGVFVYTGLVFFRELPAGVPGAYRLLANIIALNRKKAF